MIAGTSGINDPVLRNFTGRYFSDDDIAKYYSTITVIRDCQTFAVYAAVRRNVYIGDIIEILESHGCTTLPLLCLTVDWNRYVNDTEIDSGVEKYILALHRLGSTPIDIARETHVPCKSVQNLIIEKKESGEILPDDERRWSEREEILLERLYKRGEQLDYISKALCRSCRNVLRQVKRRIKNGTLKKRVEQIDRIRKKVI